MLTVKVRTSKAIANRLTYLAKENNFSSREEFLQDIFEQLANDEFQLESDKRYEELMKSTLEIIKRQDEKLEKNIELLNKFYELES